MTALVDPADGASPRGPAEERAGHWQILEASMPEIWGQLWVQKGQRGVGAVPAARGPAALSTSLDSHISGAGRCPLDAAMERLQRWEWRAQCLAWSPPPSPAAPSWIQRLSDLGVGVPWEGPQRVQLVWAVPGSPAPLGPTTMFRPSCQGFTDPRLLPAARPLPEPHLVSSVQIITQPGRAPGETGCSSPLALHPGLLDHTGGRGTCLGVRGCVLWR